MYKNTTDNTLQKKTFSSLKNSFHVEPVWFSFVNLTLCAALTTAAMVLHAIKENFRCAEAFLLRTGRFFFFIVFFKYRDKLSTKQKKFK